MSKKTKIIVIVVVVILAILVGIFTYKYIQKSNSTGTEWGDKYYIYLKEAKEKSAEERQINYGITELMENPKMIILDEPFNGVENSTADKIRDLLREEKKQDKIIIIASHIKEDIYKLADTVFEVDGGNIKEIS